MGSICTVGGNAAIRDAALAGGAGMHPRAQAGAARTAIHDIIGSVAGFVIFHTPPREPSP